MEILKIPIKEFFKYAKQSAFHDGYSWILCLVAREIDAPQVYEEIKYHWDSFNDITGSEILFVFAGRANNNQSYYDGSLIKNSDCDYRCLNNPLIYFINDTDRILPAKLYPEFNTNTYEKNDIEITHTKSISDLKEYFNLQESDIPALAFLPTFGKIEPIIIKLHSTSLYKQLKKIIEHLEPTLNELKQYKSKYEILKKSSQNENNEKDMMKLESKINKIYKLLYCKILLLDTN